MVNTGKEYDPAEVFNKVKEFSKERQFDESVDVVVKLNVDPTRGDQNIRGTCILPNGTGKEIRVCVFADKEFHNDLKEAGADIIGSEQIISEIAEGNINFDKILCT